MIQDMKVKSQLSYYSDIFMLDKDSAISQKKQTNNRNTLRFILFFIKLKSIYLKYLSFLEES